MERKQKLLYTLLGFVMGVALTAAIWFWMNLQNSGNLPVRSDDIDGAFPNNMAVASSTETAPGTSIPSSPTDTVEDEDGSAGTRSGSLASALC